VTRRIYGLVAVQLLCSNTPAYLRVTRVFLRLSVSYARDFYCSAASTGRASAKSILSPAASADEFSNVDGIYASKNVKRGCVVLTESQLPDCSLPRSANANCIVSQACIKTWRVCTLLFHLTRFAAAKWRNVSACIRKY
jgi:hypothetical protein